jgi:predicted nucleic acid-binding protein
MVVLLDTGILLRLVDKYDPLHATVRSAVRLIKTRGDVLAMTMQNAADFWNVCTRPASARGGFGLSIADTDRRLRLLEPIIQVLPDSPVAYAKWRSLVVTLNVLGVQIHDARLAALMQAHVVTHILT